MKNAVPAVPAKMIELNPQEITKRTIAIICFGPFAPTTGTKAGTFYQVVIDPKKVSPCGKFIRFIADGLCEVHGWQRIESLTICSILAEEDDAGEMPDQLPQSLDPITMLKAE